MGFADSKRRKGDELSNTDTGLSEYLTASIHLYSAIQPMATDRLQFYGTTAAQSTEVLSERRRSNPTHFINSVTEL